MKTVKAGNLLAAQARLAKAVAQIEKQGKMIDLRVTPAYHEFRLLELQLAADFQMQVQQEREAERDRRAELREQRRAQQELEAERERLIKERSHYSNVVAKLDASGDAAGAERMGEKLADVQHAIEHVGPRREFCYASPEEVLPILKSTVGEVVEYTVTPVAEEYRLSLGTPDTTL